MNRPIYKFEFMNRPIDINSNTVYIYRLIGTFEYMDNGHEWLNTNEWMAGRQTERETGW